MSLSEKELLIIAGPNGTGKSTFAFSFIEKHPDYIFLNADEIAKDRNENKNFAQKNLSAGREFFLKVEESLKENKSVLVESTLSGNYLEKLIQQYKEKGFKISIIYVFLENPDICILRIKERVLKGGHHVPDHYVIRRFYRSKRNFWNSYKKLADKWFMVYNSDNNFQQFAIGVGDDYVISNKEYFQSFIKDLTE